MTASSPASRKSVRFQFHWSSIFFIVLIISGIGAIIVLATGRVFGSEFSPSTFKLRDYVFYRLPLVHLQITPTFRWESNLQFTTTLKQSQLVSTGPIGSGRWDLVRYAAGSETMYDGPAHILTQYLENETNQHWSEWNKAHPAHAKLLWAAIQELALDEAYPIIPRVFDLCHAANEMEAVAFGQQLDDVLAEGYFEMARDDERRGDGPQAFRRYRLALKHRPNWPDAKLRLGAPGAN